MLVNQTAKDFENLGKNLGRLYFAGEATSADWYGYMQGAYITGRDKGNTIAYAILGEETGTSTAEAEIEKEGAVCILFTSLLCVTMGVLLGL